MTKRALITGITGQDGSYLAEFLLAKNYEVYGFLRRSSTEPLLRIEDLVLSKKVILINGDMRDLEAIRKALEQSCPDEIYNLAAQSDVGISYDCPSETWAINYHAVGQLVMLARLQNPHVRIYQASTSEMFGNIPPPQDERSSMVPVSPYAQAKLKAHQDFVVSYREIYGLHICSGILFNHESPRRGKHFVTRKITHSLAKIKLGLQPLLELGNLEAKRDWGFAGDYVEAMWLMLQQSRADDYVVATGESRSVQEFVEIAAKVLGWQIAWEGQGAKCIGKNQDGKVLVQVNPAFYRPSEVNYLLGDNHKARETLGWQPKVKFHTLVEMMVEADLKLVKAV